jgi:hypothetical protein
VLLAPATTDSCDIGAGDLEGSPFAFREPFRRGRVLRLPDLNLPLDVCARRCARSHCLTTQSEMVQVTATNGATENRPTRPRAVLLWRSRHFVNLRIQESLLRSPLAVHRGGQANSGFLEVG